MHKIAAELRHRELTQEIYNIGDEVAEYIEHLVEAVRDWDAELVFDCLAEFEEIVADARMDARVIIGELIGLRQALTSGVAAGVLSACAKEADRLPELPTLSAAGLEQAFSIAGTPLNVAELSYALDQRTEAVARFLEDSVQWVLAQTEAVARDLSAVSLPSMYRRSGEQVTTAVRAWLSTVADDHPAYTRTMRGANPPAFLVERARIDAIVAKVAAKHGRDRGFAS